MDSWKAILATSIISAVLVLGAVVPLGYFTLQVLNEKLEEGQSNVQRVVIELKAETLKEVQTAVANAANGTVTTEAHPDPVIMANLEQLQTNVVELQNNQQQLLEAIGNASDTMMPDASPDTPPSMSKALKQTVLFPMGKTTGPTIDEQILAMASKIAEYGKNRTCRSSVMGYSDTLGGDKSNLKLSEERARHVATLLRGKQIPVGEVKGWGERWLKVYTLDGIQNEQNRRVVIETTCDGMVSGGAASTS